MPHNFECFTNCGRDHSLDHINQQNNNYHNNYQNEYESDYMSGYRSDYRFDYRSDYRSDYETPYDEEAEAESYTTDIQIPDDFLEDFNKLKIRVDKNVCVVCRTGTLNRISSACDSNCAYYCHPDCISKWVVTRLVDSHPYCMICCLNHSIDQIPILVSDEQIKRAVDDLFIRTYIDFTNEDCLNTYKNLLEYLLYRNISF